MHAHVQKIVCKRNEAYIYIQMYIHKHMNTDQHTKMQKNILLHIHELKHVHGDTPTKLYEYICIKIQMYILTSWVRLVSVDT